MRTHPKTTTIFDPKSPFANPPVESPVASNPGKCRVLLINGPPRSGKDTIGSALRRAINNLGSNHLVCAVERKFAAYLKDAAASIYPAIQCWETDKDTPQPALFGRTKREVLINLSENHFKPLYGTDFFGRRLVDAIEELRPTSPFNRLTVMVTDSGFNPEARVLIDNYGKSNVMLMRVFRGGCTYEGDSRDYLDHKSLGLPAPIDFVNDFPSVYRIQEVADRTVKANSDLGRFLRGES